MTRKPDPSQRLDLSSQRKPKLAEAAPFESLKTKLEKRQRLADSEGVVLSRRHVDALPLSSDGVTPSFVDDWKQSR